MAVKWEEKFYGQFVERRYFFDVPRYSFGDFKQKGAKIQIYYFPKLRIMKKTLVFLTLLLLAVAIRPLVSTYGAPASEEPHGTCARFTSDKESCLECVTHFHVFEGQCYIDIHGCAEYVFGNICRRCDAGYILVNNECCDKHCMARIFKNYKLAEGETEESEEKKIQRLTVEGYENTVSMLTKTFITTSNYQFLSTSNQMLSGVIRYTIKIMVNKGVYICIADYELEPKKVSVLEFRPEKQVQGVKEVIIEEEELLSNELAKIALQFVNSKYGLRIIGMSLERVSLISEKYGTEFKFIFLSDEKSYFFQVAVTGKKYSYITWLEERTDVENVRKYVEQSINVVKLQKEPSFEIIKSEISKINKVQGSQIEVKKIEKVDENTYSYKYVNTETKQIYEEVSKVNPVTKTVEIVQKKEVIGSDLKTMKLPESGEKRIISKVEISETPEVRSVIKYLEEVQPSLATKEITNAEVEVIGETKKVTLMQKKNDQVTRVVVLSNEKTKEFKLVDESLVIATPPTKFKIEKTKEGQTKIVTNSVEKMIVADKTTVTVIEQIEKKFPELNLTKTQEVQKIEGNLTNTFTFVVAGKTLEESKQQVTVVQNKESNTIKVIDYEEIPSSVTIKPIERPVAIIPQEQYESTEMKTIIQELKKVENLTTERVVVKNAQTEDTKFVTKYKVEVETEEGPKTITAVIPYDKTEKTTITSVTATTSETQKTVINYISKVSVDQNTGVKTTVTSKPEDIKLSFVDKSSLTTVSVKEAQESVIESIVRKEYKETVTETVIMKTVENVYVQAVFEKNHKTNEVVKVAEEIIKVAPSEKEVVLPVVSTTVISQVKFKQVVKSSEVLQNVTSELIRVKPVYKEETPISTQVEDMGPKKIIIFVYVVRQTSEKERIIVEYTKETKVTVIKEETILPAIIRPVFIEKDITDGEVKVTSNSIEEVEKEYTSITKVVEQISVKVPSIKVNPVSFQVTSNPISVTYQISAVNEQTKDVVQVSVTVNRKTEEMMWNDIIETTKEMMAVKPAPKPVVILPVTEYEIPSVTKVITLVQESTEKTVDIQEIRRTDNLIATTYEVVVKGSHGIQTVTVTSDNTEQEELTLVDVLTEVEQETKPVTVLQSSTSTTVTSTSITQTSSNEPSRIAENEYLRIVRERSEEMVKELKGQKVLCFSEDKFSEVVQISFISETEWGNIQVAAFVSISSREVHMIYLPGLKDGQVEITSATCQRRNIRKINGYALVEETDSVLTGLVSYVKTHYKVGEITNLNVESFKQIKVFVVIFEKDQTVYRAIFIFSQASYNEIEGPVKIRITKPAVIQKKVTKDGSSVFISNNLQQIQTVDESITTVMESLTERLVEVKGSEVTKIVSKPHTRTVDYTITVKSESGASTDVQVIFKKDEGSVIITDVREKPEKLTKPEYSTGLIYPEYARGLIYPEDFKKNPEVITIIEEVNEGRKDIPKITKENIKKIEKTEKESSTSYTFEVETKTGSETYVVSENKKGQVQVIDYREKKNVTFVSTSKKPVYTETTVDTTSGTKIQSTNDVQIIKKSKEVQNVVKELVQENVITSEFQVVSVVTKTSGSKVQTNMVTVSPSRPEESVIVVAVTDIPTGKVTIVNEKKVVTEEGKVESVDSAVVEYVYTAVLMEQSVKKDKTLKNIITEIQNKHEEFKEVLPVQVISEKIGSKVISEVTYKTQTVTVVYDEETTDFTEIGYEKIPLQIKPVILETVVDEEGTTVINTNSVQEVRVYNQNFEKVIEVMKMNVPTILTEKILGIRVEIPEGQTTEKIVVVFETEAQEEISQISVIYNEKTSQTTVIDVQIVEKEEIIPMPKPAVPVKLSEQEIVEEKLFETIITSQELLTANIKQITSAQEIKTAFTQQITMEAVNADGTKFVIITEKDEDGELEVIDVAEVPENPEPETVTVTSVNPKSGVVTTFTNDVKVMKEEKTFKKCVDFLEKKFDLTKQGFQVQSETVSRFQRIIEHHVRFMKDSETFDYRVSVDQRTGASILLEKRNFTIDSSKPSLQILEETEPLVISSNELPQGIMKYPVIEECQTVIEAADYTFKGQKPSEVHVTHFDNSIKVVMIYKMQNKSPVRVVLFGEQKPGSQVGAKGSYKIKIVDLTTLDEKIEKTETRTVLDIYGNKKVISNNIKVLEQNNQEYNTVVQFIENSLAVLEGSAVSNVEILSMDKVNEYTLLVKKGDEVIEVKVSHKIESNKNVLIDFRSQEPKYQVEQVPIRPVQALVTVVEQQDFSKVEIKKVTNQFISEKKITDEVVIESVEIRENPRAINYIMKVLVGQIPTSIEVCQNPESEEVTIIKYHPEFTFQPVEQKPTVFTSTQTDSITGAQVTSTNNVTIINSNPVSSQIITKLTETQVVPSGSFITGWVSHDSTESIRITVVVESELEVNENHVVVTVLKKDSNEIKVISEEVLTDEEIEEVEINRLEEVVFEKKVISQSVVQKLVKSEPAFQIVVKKIQENHRDIKIEEIKKVVTEKIGKVTVTEVIFEDQAITVVSNEENEEVEEVSSEQIPEEITPTFFETTTTQWNTQVIYASGSSIPTLTTQQPQFTQVLQQITQKHKIVNQQITSIASVQTVSGNIYELVIEREESEPFIIEVFYDKETQETTEVGTIEVSEVETTETEEVEVEGEGEEQAEVVPVQEWTTNTQVVKVIEMVSQQSHVTEVSEIKTVKTGLVTKYEVVGEGKTITLVMNDETKEPEVINEEVIIISKPKTSQTSVTTKQVTNIKQTITNNQETINKNEYTSVVIQEVTQGNTQLSGAQIVEISQTDLGDVISQTSVFEVTEGSRHQVEQVTVYITKETKQVTIMETMQIDQSEYLAPIEVSIKPVALDQAYSENEILRLTMVYVQEKFPQFDGVEPQEVVIEEHFTFYQVIFVYEVEEVQYKIVVAIKKLSKEISVVSEPSKIISQTAIKIETTVTENGRVNLVSNNIEQLSFIDANIYNVLEKTGSEVFISQEDITQVQVKETSFGAIYTFTTQTDEGVSDVTVIFNERLGTVKVIDIQDCEPPVLVKPAPRPLVVMTHEEILGSSDLETIVEEVRVEPELVSFTKSEIVSVKKSETVFGASYEITAETAKGVSSLTVLKPLDGRAPQFTTIQQPQTTVSTVEQATKTTVSVDSVTGQEITKTNDKIVIMKNPFAREVIREVTEYQIIPSGVVTAAEIKTGEKTVMTTLVVESETQNKVVVASVDRVTNKVTVIAEKEVTDEEIEKIEETESEIIHRVVMPQQIYQNLIKEEKNELKIVVDQVQTQNPQVKQETVRKVVTEKIGSTTIYEIDYQTTSITVVKEDGQEQIQVISTEQIPEEIQIVELKTELTESGNHIVISNKVEKVTEIVPQATTAIIKASQVFNISTTSQVKSVSVNIEESSYNLVSVNEEGKTTQIEFIYEESTGEVVLIDSQVTSQPIVEVTQKEITYEVVEVEQETQIVEEVEQISEVKEIVQVKKSSANVAQEYVVEVITTSDQRAVIHVEKDEVTHKPQIVDIFKYVEGVTSPTIEITETINPVTQVTETTYPSEETFTYDEYHSEIKEFLKEETKSHNITSIVKEHYGSNDEYSILLKSETLSPQQVELNINKFNKEITVLQNKTVVSKEVEEVSPFDRNIPTSVKLALNHFDQEKIEIISKLSSVKNINKYETVTDVQSLEKNQVFVNAVEEVKKDYEHLLKDSTIVKVLKKETLDETVVRVFFLNSEDSSKDLYEADIKMNPISGVYNIQEFSKVGDSEEKSELNISADIAYGYTPMANFAGNKNVEFILNYLKEHYNFMENSILQSVEWMNLCDGKANYKIFVKNDLQIVKFIVFYEEKFKRVMQIRSFPFEMAGQYSAIPSAELLRDPYFRSIDKVLKENHEEVTEGSTIIHAERKDAGEFFAYRIIYANNGKTYHSSAKMNKEIQEIVEDFWNEIIEVPTIREDPMYQAKEQYTVLRINDLAHNSNFENAHREVLAQFGSFLQNSQMLGAKQKTEMFTVFYTFFFVIDGEYFKIESQLDSSTQKITVASDPEKISLSSGYSFVMNEGTNDIIDYVQSKNPDLHSAVVMETGHKPELFGMMYKIVFKLPTKFVTTIVLKEGDDVKILNQQESTSLDSTMSVVRGFPRPGGSSGGIQLNAV